MKDREKELWEQKNKYEEPKMSEVQVAQMKKKIEQAKKENRQKGYIGRKVSMAAVAVLAVMFILPNTSAQVAHAMEQVPILSKWVEVVTFRDYQYEDERNSADIQVPQLVVNPENQTEDAKENTDTGKDIQTEQQMQLTTEEINAQIDKITKQMIAEFEEGLKAEEGYQSMSVTSDVIATTDTYFTLRLNCYQGAGSGAEWNYYYTIDLRTGEQVQLADLFREGADYITPISENIKEQMWEQMAADDMVTYWLDDPEVEEWNFDKITDDTGFYLNEAGEVVIAFNEGDVAPMYMGCVQFTIPNEVLENIRK